MWTTKYYQFHKKKLQFHDSSAVLFLFDLCRWMLEVKAASTRVSCSCISTSRSFSLCFLRLLQCFRMDIKCTISWFQIFNALSDVLSSSNSELHFFKEIYWSDAKKTCGAVNVNCQALDCKRTSKRRIQQWCIQLAMEKQMKPWRRINRAPSSAEKMLWQPIARNDSPLYLRKGELSKILF